MTNPPPIRPDAAPRFDVGERVRIDDRDSSLHNRVPAYVRGHVGTVVLVARAYGEPERLAYGDRAAPRRPLYRVRLPARDLWPDDDVPCDDTLDVEIFEHWLERAP